MVTNDVVLNSPWDVCYDPSEENVYIAMAGQHQIWKHNVRDGATKVSGDGYERNLNGSSATAFGDFISSLYSWSPFLLHVYNLMPLSIRLMGTIPPESQELFVADSESSSIRAVNLKTGGSRLLAGEIRYFQKICLGYFHVPAMYDGAQQFGYAHGGGFDYADMNFPENKQMSKSTAFLESNYLKAFPEKEKAAPVAKIKVVVRKRPLDKREISKEEEDIIDIE
ncbi:hypothetical protein ACP4OV_013076 [Aristida adscensionis]